VRARWLLLLVLPVCGWAAGTGDSAPPWTRRVEAGLNVTEGNKDTSRQRVEAALEGKGTNWQTEVKVEGVVGSSDGEQDQEKVNARLHTQRDLGSHWYGSFTVDYAYDGIADLDYRVVVSPGVGRHLVRDDVQQLRAEAGPAYIVEKKGRERDEYPALRLAEFYEGRVARSARLKQAIEYLPDLQEGTRYLLNARLELESDLDENLALGVKLEGRYDSRPAEDKEKQDTTFSTSLKFRF